MRRLCCFSITIIAAAWSALTCAEEPDAEQIAFFEKDIRPILARRCYECHSAESKTLKGGLRVDHRAGVLQGGDSGPAVVPGKPEESLLLAAVRYSDEIQMPPDGKLPDQELALLTEWVETMSAHIKSIDPNHLVGAGDEGFYALGEAGEHWTEQGGDGVDTVAFASAPSIDVLSAHLYPEDWGTDADWGTEWITRHIADAKAIGKPVAGE